MVCVSARACVCVCVCVCVRVCVWSMCLYDKCLHKVCLLIFLMFTELQYGIVTNPTVATAIGLPNAPSIVMYSTTHGMHQYIGTFDRAKFRNWTSTHYHYRVVNKLQWNGVLGGSFAILFVPLNHTELTMPVLREYKSAATRYQAVLHSSKVSCYNLKHFKHSACMPSIPQSLYSQYDDYYCSVFPGEQYYSRMECQSSLHDSVLMLPYSCMLKCYPLNMMFLYADSFILLSLMRKMGLEDSHKPSLMIVDTKVFSYVRDHVI